MVSVKIDEDVLVDALVSRVSFWNEDESVLKLYRQMYEDYAYNGIFDGSEIDIQYIVDNDYINNCTIIYEDDEDYENYKMIYDNGNALTGSERGYVEALGQGMLLVRWY